MDKFKDRYRIPSARWATWDYSANAAYFITICTARRIHFFGEIVDGVMNLTTLGQAAVDCWQIIPTHFPFVLVDAYVVMPNHIHGILIIDKRGDGNDRGYHDMGCGGNVVVETQNFASLQTQPPIQSQPQPPTQPPMQPQTPPQIQSQIQPQTQPSSPRNQFGPQRQTLASIVRGYKIGVTQYARQNDLSFSWQSRYIDHVIRNATEQERIR